MIQSIKVNGFLQQFNYELNFNDSSITFITAPNGYGKTTLLNSIAFLFEERWKDLCSIVFDTIEINFIHDTFLIKKENQIEESDEDIDSDQSKISSILSVYLNGKLCVQAICIFGDDLKIVGRVKVLKKQDYKYAFKLFMGTQKLLYIPESRLYQSSKDAEKNHLAVEESRERDFIPWIIGLRDNARKILAEEEPVNYLTDPNDDCELKNFWTQLKEFNLINSSEDVCSNAKLKMLKTTLGPSVEKLKLFSSIIEQSELTNKKFTIDADFGFVFKLEDEYNSILDLSLLSSGEKQLLTIVYHLLFDKNIEKGSIILIDEPEISFHMSWQVRFLETLRRIHQNKPMQFIIATHSPQIFELNFKNTIDLFDLSEKELDNER